jgi:hypothetical protein
MVNYIYFYIEHRTKCAVDWRGLPSAHALGLGDVRLKLTCPICGTYGKHFLASSFSCPHVCLPKNIGTMCGTLQASIVHAGPSGSNVKPLVRQAKFGVSCRVKVPAEQGLTSQSYRVLQ